MKLFTAALLKAAAPVPMGPPNPLQTHSVTQEELRRLMQREGGYSKITRDSGGTTKGGIAESSGDFTADQIRRLTPAQIDSYWKKRYARFNRLQNPGVRELMFDIEANAGPGTASAILQRAINPILPAGHPPLKVDYNAGPGTFRAASSVMQDELAERVMQGYAQHHQKLVAKNPAKYGNGKGWTNRRAALWNSPNIVPLHRVKAEPSPAPVKVQGVPPAGYQVVKNP